MKSPNAKIPCRCGHHQWQPVQEPRKSWQSIRAHHPEIPILASGGGREDRILATIDAGADAITWTPPSAQQLQSQMMAKYVEKSERQLQSDQPISKSLRWRRVFHRRLLATAKPLVS